ncbi:helix-turn-helix transcriptional regulator [Thalassotalea sp. G2M2-11]|uniref:helix-turn-helix domain-containing protein n=1 Tax=Thalassotalea sp. G2M2-11 TaxID=2787627 RepID=UPI0019D178FF|nr:helix-turn-helix transcriptional regulator [Thalassotalea sp. G2M2-11]
MSESSSTLSPERIKQLRLDNGWSQELLAKAAGLSLRTIQRAEKDGNCSAETQLALAAAFDTSPKELFAISTNPDVNWKRKNIMQSFLALLVVCGAILMLVLLGGDLGMFADFYGVLFLILFTYSSTVIAFGSHGLIKSIYGLSYIFANDINHSPASEFLSLILKRQVIFIYGAAFIAFLIGTIAIFSSEEAISTHSVFYPAFAVNLLIVLYAAIIAEGVLRPLSTKLAHRALATKFE